jgi:hypothetical protein
MNRLLLNVLSHPMASEAAKTHAFWCEHFHCHSFEKNARGCIIAGPPGWKR